MRLIAVAVICALLAGCAAEAVKPVQIVEVKVPVPVTCVDSLPPIPQTVMPDPEKADTAQLAAGAATDVINLQLYAEKTHALLIQCANIAEAP